ncbi:sigma-54 dependent transcriptional regulator [Rurimicrobium arvi]|uniref:Sigma-54 dependent transcriptional regulator n=1 Tax=Rurimicrobium arvi TaxID=2049916 RepID=A0ABP8MET2_9BACT
MNPTILIIDDEEKLRGLLKRIISLEGYAVKEAASLASGRQLLASGGIDIVLCDVKLPDGNGVDFVGEVTEAYPALDIVLLTAYGNIPDGVKAIKRGAFDYLVKGDDNEKIIPVLSQLTVIRQEKKRTVRMPGGGAFESVIGDSPATREAISLARKVAATDTAVLLMGETGTGKEIFAHAIHAGSARSGSAFVALNCSAFSRDLLESELFGHKSGAFTGAVKDKKGLIEEANGGTLFLDEIGEMPVDLQPKLLRLLENGTYMRVGDTKELKADIRIIAATNRRLEDEIEKGVFRSDLYYRIAVFTITLSALRDRAADIPALAQHFLSFYAGRAGKSIAAISDTAMLAIVHYPWKGNIRELKNAMERAVILEDTGILMPGSLPLSIQQATSGQDAQASFQLASVEKQHIRKVLQHTKGNKTEAARLMGIGLATLYRKLEEYGLK